MMWHTAYDLRRVTRAKKAMRALGRKHPRFYTYGVHISWARAQQITSFSIAKNKSWGLIGPLKKKLISSGHLGPSDCPSLGFVTDATAEGSFFQLKARNRLG
jgi:hypothetical protein